METEEWFIKKKCNEEEGEHSNGKLNRIRKEGCQTGDILSN